MDPATLLDARLLVVTGKGGTGKTTVAAALALAAARKGHQVLLAEVEGRQGLARLFGAPALAHEPAALGERLDGIAPEPRAALREHLDRLGVPLLAGLLDGTGLGELLTAAAPGLADALLLGTLADHAASLVVLDAPPSGRVTAFLRAPATAAGLARIGPAGERVEQVAGLLADPALTRVVLTVVPEALPVTEALETAAALEAAGFALGLAVADRVEEAGPGVDTGRLAALARDPAPLLAAAGRHGLALGADAARALVAEGVERRRRLADQDRLLERLRAGLGAGVAELPLLPRGAAGPVAVRALARRLGGLGPGARRPRGAAR
ncbi:MAG TPA: ArsA-related P-loop ATPase [Actinomycetes bacterium]|nr:ArsA-related P-loop ATPase [Actinomycetes bacterium]